MFGTIGCSQCLVRVCNFATVSRTSSKNFGFSVSLKYLCGQGVRNSGQICAGGLEQNVCNVRSQASTVRFHPCFVSRALCSEVPRPAEKQQEKGGEATDIYSSIDYKEIAGGDEALMKKLKVIALEVEVLRQEGHRVPSSMAADRWRDLLMLETKSQRMRLLAFWWTNEKKREADKRKKQERKKKREEELAMIKEGETDDGHIKYGFGGSTIFIRVYDSKIDAMHNSKLVRAMQFGQDLVVDCSYTSHMTIKEASNCAKQMMMMFAENRIHDDPFNMHFCSAVRDDNVMSRLFKFIPTMYDASFPMNITPKSHLDLFPKERLVYLTPHCREELRTYSHHDVYIIGAMVDKANNEPLSLAKAKSQGLRMAKLPLDRYLAWGMGSKSLTLNQVLAILLDMKSNGGDWEAALRKNVPQRKVVTKEQAEREISARIRQERRRQQRLYY